VAEAAAKRPALAGLVTLRLLAPAIVLALCLVFRNRLLELLDRTIGHTFVFTFVQHYSTLSVRILILLAIALVLLAAWFGVIRRFDARFRALAFGFVGAGLAVLVLLWFRSWAVAVAAAALVLAVLLLNSIERARIEGLLNTAVLGPLIRAGLWVGIGVEALVPRPYLLWLFGSRDTTGQGGKPVTWGILAGALIASAIVAALIPYPALMRIGERLFLSPHAEIVFGPQYFIRSEYDVSDIAIDAANDRAFLCGDAQRTAKLHALSSGQTTDSGIDVGGNEFCEFDPIRRLFLSVDGPRHEFIAVSADTLTETARIALPDLPPGEILLSVQPETGYFVAASENEGGTGTGADIRVIGLERMEVITEIDADAGYVITHPDQPVLYINHFAKDLGVRSYDMRSGEKLGGSVLFGRSDRMAFDTRRNHVLATAPVTGKIFRFDARDLSALDPINTVFGARGLAVDHGRDLLLVSSFLTNMVDVIDLSTGKSLRRYRLGSWMRDIRVIGDSGVALVASRYALYRLNYLE